MQHRALQPKYGDRSAEDQRGIDVASQVRWLAQREKDANHQVEDKEKNQKRFGAGEVLGAIAQDAPGSGDHKGEQKPCHVERTPGLEPRSDDDDGIEHGVVGEQHHMIALPVRCEDGRQKSAGCREQFEGQGILHNRKHRRERRQHHQQR